LEVGLISVNAVRLEVIQQTFGPDAVRLVSQFIYVAGNIAGTSVSNCPLDVARSIERWARGIRDGKAVYNLFSPVSAGLLEHFEIVPSPLAPPPPVTP